LQMLSSCIPTTNDSLPRSILGGMIGGQECQQCMGYGMMRVGTMRNERHWNAPNI
jgi:hypothetical protein